MRVRPPLPSLILVALAVAIVPVVPVAVVPVPAGATTDRAGFETRGSVEQVSVVAAHPGATARLLDATGETVAHRAVDAQGSTLFRRVEPGSGYRVQVGPARGAPVDVAAADALPDPSLYSSQRLGPGFGYLTTRDGTLLSVNVTLPGPVEEGPYPTVVEYSGYEPSNPAARSPGSFAAQLLGYATVGVNVRGTGCSGGAWDYFETLQTLDGYDTIETVAAQPWVAHGAVGMVGISYSGITQLFVAAARPPHLAAITPLSVIDDTYATLFPGGIFNDGFALEWARARADDAQPAGRRWVRDRIAAGDTTCEANQALRLQTPDVEREIRELGHDRGRALEAVAPATFAGRIEVPVFIAGAWQDEETGAHFAQMLDDFRPETIVKATLMNGRHADSLGPAVVQRWAEFLDFYVARRVPVLTPEARQAAAVAFQVLYGGAVALPPDRFDPAEGYEAARARYEREPPVRVLFESGAAGHPDVPLPAFEALLASWPPPRAAATPWYLDARGSLVSRRPDDGGTDRFVYDPAAFPRSNAGGWQPLPARKAVSYLTERLASDTVVLGAASVDLWLRADAPDVDLEVTVTEVRPDGQEVYVQSGWLRASRRALDARASTASDPVPTFRRADTRPLREGRAALVRVPVYPFGHVFRAGSRIRVAVQPPGGNRPAWTFDALTYRRRVVTTIERTARHPSRVVLPVVEGIPVPTPLPGCGTLLGQPCRQYVPTVNGGIR